MSAGPTLYEALAHAKAGYVLGPVTVRQTPGGAKAVQFHTTWKSAGGTSRDPEQLKQWANEHPGCSFHAPCAPNGIVVVDLDGEDGVENWHRLGGPGSRMTVMTRSGGRHVYFRAPDAPIRNSAGVIAPHVDVRGQGGTVFISGTVVHGSDYRYVATRILAPNELPRLPDEWATRLREAGPSGESKPSRRRARVHGLRSPDRARTQGPVRLSHTREWIEARARVELRQLGRSTRDGFGKQLYTAALTGYRAVICGALEVQDVDMALAEAMVQTRGHLGTSDLNVLDRARRDAAAEPWEVTA